MEGTFGSKKPRILRVLYFYYKKSPDSSKFKRLWDTKEEVAYVKLSPSP